MNLGQKMEMEIQLIPPKLQSSEKIFKFKDQLQMWGLHWQTILNWQFSSDDANPGGFESLIQSLILLNLCHEKLHPQHFCSFGNIEF